MELSHVEENLLSRKEELELRKQRRGLFGLTEAEHKELFELTHAETEHGGDTERSTPAEEISGLDASDSGESSAGADRAIRRNVKSAGRLVVGNIDPGVREEEAEISGEPESE